jgi:hypothetical protein
MGSLMWSRLDPLRFDRRPDCAPVSLVELKLMTAADWVPNAPALTSSGTFGQIRGINGTASTAVGPEADVLTRATGAAAGI